MKYIAVELGGTNLRYSLVSSDLEVLKFEKISTASLSGAEDKVLFFRDLILPLIQEAGRENVAAVTMALSSLMDKGRSWVYSSPMVRGFDNIPLKSELEKRIGLPVVLEKDVNILLLYELHRKKLSKSGITAGFFLGTGLGNSISIDGKVYSGSSGSAGELGHIPVPELREECNCGKKGCIELKACGRILEELATVKYRCPIRDVFALHGSSPEIRELIRYFAYAIATEIGILDPECVIVGGGLVEMEGFPKSELISQIKENIRAPYPRQSLSIDFASGDLIAGVVGAVIHAKNALGSA